MAKNKKDGASRYLESAQKSAIAGDSTQKYDSDVFNGKKQMTNFFEIETSQLKEFSLKDEFDFSEWDEEKFDSLVVSIKEFGVLQPIIVRHSPDKDKEHPYEILAGEHRWKASKKLNLDNIPAKILHQCDDNEAKSIFMLTNILSRDLTLIDKIHGWGHYYEMTKGKTKESIQKLKEDGIISDDANSEELSKRTIKRYAEISELEAEFLKYITQGVIGVWDASLLAEIPKEKRLKLLKYVDQIKTKKHFKNLLNLYNGKVINYSFDAEGIQFILSGDTIEVAEEEKNNFTFAAKTSRKSLKNVLKETDYHRAAQVTESGIGLYYQLQEHPELLMKLYHSTSGEAPIDESEIENLGCDAIEKVLDSSILIKALEAYLK